MIARKAIEPKEYDEISELLKSHGLPTADLHQDQIVLFGFYEGEQLIASGAIEDADDCKLIRSVAVREDSKRRGFGSNVLRYLENAVREAGNSEVFIITEIPEYFDKHSYESISRDKTPEPIRETEEFSELCPDTAIIMKKKVK